MLDINPFSRVGIMREDVDFIHLLILWLCSLDKADLSDREQIRAIENIKTAALYDDSNRIILDGESICVRRAAKETLDKIRDFAQKYLPEFFEALDFQYKKLGGNRYARLVRDRFGSDYLNLGLELARQYAERGDPYV